MRIRTASSHLPLHSIVSSLLLSLPYSQWASRKFPITHQTLNHLHPVISLNASLHTWHSEPGDISLSHNIKFIRSDSSLILHVHLFLKTISTTSCRPALISANPMSVGMLQSLLHISWHFSHWQTLCTMCLSLYSSPLYTTSLWIWNNTICNLKTIIITLEDHPYKFQLSLRLSLPLSPPPTLLSFVSLIFFLSSTHKSYSLSPMLTIMAQIHHTCHHHHHHLHHHLPISL